MSIKVNCHHWSAGGVLKMNSQDVVWGRCDHPDACDPDTGTKFGPRPSVGVCKHRCIVRQPVDPSLPSVVTGELTMLTVKGAPREIPQELRDKHLTLSKIVSFAEAKLTAKKVSLDVLNQRLEKCQDGCAFARVDPVDGLYCKACSCLVSNDPDKFQNLAALQENMKRVPGFNPKLVQWGCKHPERFDKENNYTGKGWDPSKNEEVL